MSPFFHSYSQFSVIYSFYNTWFTYNACVTFLERQWAMLIISVYQGSISDKQPFVQESLCFSSPEWTRRPHAKTFCLYLVLAYYLLKRLDRKWVFCIFNLFTYKYKHIHSYAKKKKKQNKINMECNEE